MKQYIREIIIQCTGHLFDVERYCGERLIIHIRSKNRMPGAGVEREYACRYEVDAVDELIVLRYLLSLGVTFIRLKE